MPLQLVYRLVKLHRVMERLQLAAMQVIRVKVQMQLQLVTRQVKLHRGIIQLQLVFMQGGVVRTRDLLQLGFSLVAELELPVSPSTQMLLL